MAKNTSECGKRDERELVKDLKDRGYEARRQPGSGNVDPTLPHDVEWKDSPIGKLLIECKWRADCGWRTMLRWMDGAPILTVNCDGRRDQDGDRYVFMKWDTFMALVGSAADRSEIAADLPSVEPWDTQDLEPDKPWVNEPKFQETQGASPFLKPVDGWDCPEGCQEDNKRVYIWGGSNYPCPIHGDGSEAKMLGAEQGRRARIQAAHKNPPQRKREPNKLKGRGFGK